MTEPYDGRRTSVPPAPGFPRGYRVDTCRPDVYDPALRHYPRAFVKGDPTEPAAAQRVRDTRAWLLSRALVALSRAGFRDALVVRGSVALERWFPLQARRPHDIDLVARDPRWAPDDARSMNLMDSIRAVVVDAMVRADVRVLAREVTVDEIWTYERAEGRRLSIPWEAAGDLRDAVQVDLVFREPLQDAPSLEPVGELEVARGYRDAPVESHLWFASRAESLAWKLLWLETDANPRAKDLYDAVLLAERVVLPLDLAQRVYTAKGAAWAHDVDAAFVRSWAIADEGFAQEHPELAFTDPSPWLDRLASALVITR